MLVWSCWEAFNVTDSFHRVRYCTCVTFCETADKEVTITSSSFKMDASKEIKIREAV